MNNKKTSLLAAALLIIYPVFVDAMTNAEAKSLATAAYKGNTTSLKRLQQAAGNGNAAAQEWLGEYYFANKLYVQGVGWFRKAADQGNIPAEFELGLAYKLGNGVPQNYAKYIEWDRKAADQGNVPAELGMAWGYMTGHGVPQNYAKSNEWDRKAANQGNALAEFELGFAYYKGHGTPQNRKKAIYWLKKAADQGNALAEQELEVADPTHHYPSLMDLFNASPYSNKGNKYHIYFSRVIQVISRDEDLLEFQGRYYLASFKGYAPPKGDFISGYCSGLGATRYKSVTNELKVVPHVLFYNFKAYNLDTIHGQEMSIMDFKKQLYR